MAEPSLKNGTHNDEDEDDLLTPSMQHLGWDAATQRSLRECLREAGFDVEPHSSSEGFGLLLTLCRDYRPSDLARMLMDDFGIQPALRAHQLRATIVQALRLREQQRQQQQPVQQQSPEQQQVPVAQASSLASDMASLQDGDPIDGSHPETFNDDAAANSQTHRQLYKSVQVNSAAARRKQDRNHISYGLLDDYRWRHPILAEDLDRFWEFMTRPTPLAQEEPIRPATATVYLRHAKLYLGWYLSHHRPRLANGEEEIKDATVSLSSVFPFPDAEAATPLIEFVLWLRAERSISASYEANVLRGLSKLVKFRFADRSRSPQSSTHAYDDVPLVLELRKLHRVANRQQRLSPRSSDEQRKWISWPDYLRVVEACRVQAERLLQAHEEPNPGPVDPEAVTPQERAIAAALQRYLVLAIFANVPDRQRTVRELVMGKTLVWDDPSTCWCIRHAPKDYKTGKTYGERPPLHLPVSLSETITTFQRHWRQCLRPSADPLFVQPRTGRPLTSDSVYQLVSRACFEHTGRRTNPHLLRDMIVTHVRDASQASETELEALALFMGHSLHMQRTSYDRRTLTRKVAPAIQLLQTVNGGGPHQSPPP